MTDSMNEWVHARAQAGGEIKTRIFEEATSAHFGQKSQEATSGQSGQKSDPPKQPRGNAGAGCGSPPPAPPPNMDDFMRGRVRRR